MSTNSPPPFPPPADQAPVAASLYQLLAPFTGYRYNFLLALLKDPSRILKDVCHELGIQEQTAWNWKSTVPGFRQAFEAIREGRADLRTEYAKLAFLEATPRVADAMVERALTPGLAGQRAGERVLETVGVLQRDPIQVAVVDPTRELVAELREHMRRAMAAPGVVIEALPEPEAAERALAKVLGPRPVVVKEERSDESSGSPS